MSSQHHHQLILAREFRGYSQSELSSKVSGLSQPNLSKYEKGLGGLSEELLKKIMNELKIPFNFLMEKVYCNIENAHFRKRTTITKKHKRKLESVIKVTAYMVDKLNESIDWPDFTLTPLDINEGYTPEYIAQFTRKKLGLTQFMAVKDICSLLENHGVLIVEQNVSSEKFDGVSIITNNGTPLIIINKSIPNDRKRFTIAHELGHILMHIAGDFAISTHRDKEQEANNFASEFLMPKAAIFNTLLNLKYSDLRDIKSFWLTSFASIIRRAKDLGCITAQRCTNLYIELSRRGQRKIEPWPVFIDSPNLYTEAYNIHCNVLNYSKDDFINGFSLSLDILIDLLFPKTKVSPTLRVV